MQDGTFVELEYPVTADSFILHHLNYSKLITLSTKTGKEKKKKKSPNLECDSIFTMSNQSLNIYSKLQIVS